MCHFAQIMMEEIRFPFQVILVFSYYSYFQIERTISNDKMLKFIHHAEQQVHQYQKKANEVESLYPFII